LAHKEVIAVSFLGWSRKHTLVETWKKLNVTPSSGSHSIGDTYTRGRKQFTYDDTLFCVDSGEPSSASLELHLEKLAARMKEASECYKEIFDDVTVRITCQTSYVATEIELNPTCLKLVNQIGVGLAFSFSVRMDDS
jgi:hypothetical protein